MTMQDNNQSEMSRAAKASLWFLICNVLQKGMTAICTPIFTRIMDTSSYGDYTVYQSWHQIVAIFVTLNLSAGVLNNVLTENYHDSKRICSSFLGLSTVVSIIYLGLAYLFKRIIASYFHLNSVFIYLMILESLFSGAYSIWAAKERYDYKYKGIVATTLLAGIGGTLITITAVMLSNEKSFTLIVSNASIQIINGLFFYIFLIYRGKKIVDRKYWIFAISFNLPLIPHYLSYILLNQSDRLMIDYYLGKSATALYGVAYSISMIMMLIVTAINNTLIPFTYKSIKTQAFSRIYRLGGCLINVCFVGCILAMLLGPEFIRLFASSDYYQAVIIIPPVGASVFFMFCQSLISTVAFYFKKTKFVMTATSISAVINVILNRYFIQYFGYSAAAYTTLFSYLFLMSIHFVYYKKMCKHYFDGQFIFEGKTIWRNTIGLIITIPLITALYKLTIIRWSVIIVFLIILIHFRSYFIDQIKMLREE